MHAELVKAARAALYLLAAATSAVWPRTASAEVEVAVIDPLIELRDAADLAGLTRRDALRLVGPRNGFCSAQVIVTGEGADEVRAQVSDLKSPDGAIPADAVQVRYAANAPSCAMRPRRARRSYPCGSP